jgi:hypothetical protein
MELLRTTWNKILAGEPNAVGFFGFMVLVMAYVVYMMIRKRKSSSRSREESESIL